MSVEIDKSYLEEIAGAKRKPDKPEVVRPEQESRESGPEDTPDSLDSSMKTMKERRPGDATFEPENQLWFDASRRKQEASDLENQVAELRQSIEHGTRFGNPAMEAQIREKRLAEELAPLEKKMEELQYDAAILDDSARNLHDTGEDKWADKHFADQERKEAEGLQVALAEATALENRGIGDTKDVDEMEARVKAIKEAKKRVTKYQNGLRRASEQRQYLELMKKRAQLLKNRPQA